MQGRKGLFFRDTTLLRWINSPRSLSL